MKQMMNMVCSTACRMCACMCMGMKRTAHRLYNVTSLINRRFYEQTFSTYSFSLSPELSYRHRLG